MAQGQNSEIKIDIESGIPIWLQLRNRLVYLISSEQIEVGTKLPTVREMAVELGINYNTVSKVYQDIERDGFIVSKRGKGTFVQDSYKERGKAATDAVDSLIDDFIRQCTEIGISVNDIPLLITKRIDETVDE